MTFTSSTSNSSCPCRHAAAALMLTETRKETPSGIVINNTTPRRNTRMIRSFSERLIEHVPTHTWIVHRSGHFTYYSKWNVVAKRKKAHLRTESLSTRWPTNWPSSGRTACIENNAKYLISQSKESLFVWWKRMNVCVHSDEMKLRRESFLFDLLCRN